MKTKKDIKLGKNEVFVEDFRESNTRCPNCGGILIANFGAGISVEFCAERRINSYLPYFYERNGEIYGNYNQKHYKG